MKVIVYGYGLMGKKVANRIRSQNDMDLIAVVSYQFDEKIPEKCFNSLKECDEKADVIIDFSHPNNLDDILTYAKENKCKLVIATTGYSEEQLEKIKEASKDISIFQSYNTSFGVQMVTKMLRQFAKEFYDAGYDIEILEKHHNQKIDAPSGTAELLYEVMAEEIDGVEACYDRSSRHEKRKKEEIGIQSLRGGTIFGEHTIMFAGVDEIIEINIKDFKFIDSNIYVHEPKVKINDFDNGYRGNEKIISSLISNERTCLDIVTLPSLETCTTGELQIYAVIASESDYIIREVFLPDKNLMMETLIDIMIEFFNHNGVVKEITVNNLNIYFMIYSFLMDNGIKINEENIDLEISMAVADAFGINDEIDDISLNELFEEFEDEEVEIRLDDNLDKKELLN